ncbi:acyltransferase [Pyxidicoccus fallax]|uniref:Acyltransferase n=1 Tax=Pyxidicoccus fallax TaxID=394095 RepID=A0A848LH58_9BACT|nr:acyltransferase [Pyxidicoccus fallax]NMO15628.1 acyltransferase [Pyxidicoccus fallax]NPC77225.1 acyltransferase [Pyxidicoccus fallax]
MRTALRPLPALTGLRFLAAFHVVVFHYLERSGMPTWLANVADSGSNSVTLFFILSGFILAYSYLGAESEVEVPRRSFWVARFARVYPVYLLGLLLAAPIFVGKLFQQQGLTGQSLWTVTGIGAAVGGLSQAWFPAAACQWNCPGWSLSVEAFFYLVFPFAALPVLRMGARRLLVALGVSALVGVLLMGVWLFVLWWGTEHGSGFDRDAWKVVGAYNPLLRLPQFLCGVFLGRLFCLRQRDGRASASFDRAMVALGVGSSLVLLGLTWGRPALYFKDMAMLPGFMCLIWGLAGGADPLSRFLARPFMVKLGEASYALYLLHSPVNNWLQAADTYLGLGWWSRGPAFFIGYSLLCVAASLAVFRYVEEPARRWLRDRLSARVKPALQAPLDMGTQATGR